MKNYFYINLGWETYYTNKQKYDINIVQKFINNITILKEGLFLDQFNLESLPKYRNDIAKTFIEITLTLEYYYLFHIRGGNIFKTIKL